MNDKRMTLRELMLTALARVRIPANLTAERLDAIKDKPSDQRTLAENCTMLVLPELKARLAERDGA